MTDTSKLTDKQWKFIEECRIDETGILDWYYMLVENGGTWTEERVGGIVGSLANQGFLYVEGHSPSGDTWWACCDDEDYELFPNNCYEY